MGPSVQPRAHFRTQTRRRLAVADVDGDTTPTSPRWRGLERPRRRHFGKRSRCRRTSTRTGVANAVADFNLDGRPDIALAPGDAFGDLCSVGVFLNWTGLPAPPCIVPPVDQEFLWRAPVPDYVALTSSSIQRLRRRTPSVSLVASARRPDLDSIQRPVQSYRARAASISS